MRVITSRSRGSTRAFIALDPPAAVREELAAWFRQTRVGPRLRPVKPDYMHLTLAFLGNREEGELSLIGSILDEFADSAPVLALGAPAWLPPRHPRTLVVEVRGLDAALTELQSGIAGSLAGALGWREPRAFRPHITVARLPRDFRPRPEALPPTPQIEFPAESLTLYRSHLLPEGAEYESIQRWQLTRS